MVPSRWGKVSEYLLYPLLCILLIHTARGGGVPVRAPGGKGVLLHRNVKESVTRRGGEGLLDAAERRAS